MQDDELKQEFTVSDICEACDFSEKTFYEYKKSGEIPLPDDKRKPYIWYRRTILPFIEKWLESKASQPPQP